MRHWVAITSSVLLLACSEPDPSYCSKSPYAAATGWSGHRAATLSHPSDIENSHTSLRHTLESPPVEGPHRVEFDVMTTKDNQLVVIHDARTCRVGAWDVEVSETALGDLPPLLDGSSVPLLKDYVDSILDHDGHLVVEFDLKDIRVAVLGELGSYVDRVRENHAVVIRMKGSEYHVNRLDQYCSTLGLMRRYYSREGKWCRYDIDSKCGLWCSTAENQ